MNNNVQFYKMQFDMINKNEEQLKVSMDYSKKKMDEILELTQLTPKNSLELGSGMGLDAISLNLNGVEVDALEIVEELNDFGKELQSKYSSSVNFIQGDFFKFKPNKKYDLIYYNDGFGVSTYEDQVELLGRIESWLKEDGKCFIEVYNLLYWKKVDGVEMKISDNVDRIYGYDYEGDRFLDTWTSSETNFSYTQEMQCYLPDEIYKMVESTNMIIEKIQPGGAMDFEKWEYHSKVSLEECLLYKVILKKR